MRHHENPEPLAEAKKNVSRFVIGVARIVEKTGRSPAEATAAILKGTPLDRFVQPREVAAAVLYLCSPDAAAVTGSTLMIAGGEA